MSYSITFERYRPTPRFPPADTPWTGARIEESETAAGPWTEVETLVFTDPDADPTDPTTRSFTTELGTLSPGWYRVVFLDDDGDEEVTDPVAFPPPDSLRPTIDDIGALLHARTNAGGTELGTFTTQTRPTADQVDGLIDIAVADVQARVGTTIAAALVDEARRLASLQAAALVEASFFPNELETDRSAYRQYTAMYLSGVQALTDDARRPAALRLV